jgi:hypothetical protein
MFTFAGLSGTLLVVRPSALMNRISTVIAESQVHTLNVKMRNNKSICQRCTETSFPPAPCPSQPRHATLQPFELRSGSDDRLQKHRFYIGWQSLNKMEFQASRFTEMHSTAPTWPKLSLSAHCLCEPGQQRQVEKPQRTWPPPRLAAASNLPDGELTPTPFGADFATSFS